MMENVSPAEGQDRSMMNKKLRSPNQIGETHTMDSFQDGGQQNMNTEQNEYMNPMEGPHMNADANSFPPSSREQIMMVDTFNRMNQNVHASQMQGYNPYNRENFNSGDQHGGMAMTGSSEYTNQGSHFQGQYARPGHPGSMKPGMRPGMGPPGGNMMPSSYPHSQRNMMSGQSISQQAGPTPTLNQLLQTPNAPQRMPSNNYGDYPPKGANDVGGSNPNYSLQQQWVGNQRQMGMFPQNMISGPGSGYRNQNMSDMNQQRSASYQMQQSQYGGQYPPPSRYGTMGMPSRPGQMNVPNQSFNQMGPHYGQQQQQFNSMGYGAGPPPPMSQPPSSSSHPTHHPQSQQQNSQMSSGQPPGITPPPPTGSRPSPSPIPDSPMHQRQLSPSPSRQQQQQPTPSSQTSTSPSPQQVPLTKQQPSPSGNGSNWNATNNGIKKGSEENESGMEQPGNEDVASDNLQGIPTSSSTQQPSVSALRPTPSPVGSSGSRSNTPASLTGNQAGSPMPPRPPSQHDGQTSRLTQSPMSTQGYNQQMMPPPMGPNQMNYGQGGGKMPGGNVSGPMGHYQQYNSHYPPQGNYPGRQGPGMMSNTGMQSYSQQNMYNGPNQGQMGGNSHLYNNMQGGRNMPNSNFNMYGQNSMMGMNSQYGQLNSHMGPGPPNQGSGQGPGPGPVSGPVPAGMNSMGHSGVENVPGSGSGHRQQGPNTASSSGSSSAVKSAQAAAQAALIAAANTATRSQPGRPSVNTPQKMFGPHSGGQVNHSGYGSGVNMNNVPTSMNQMPNSHSPVPNSVGPYLNMPKSSVSDSMPNMADSSTHNSSTSQSNCPPTKAVDSSVSSSMDTSDSKLPSSQNIPPVSVENMQHDSNSVSSNLSSESVPPLDTNVNNSTAISVPPQSCSLDSNKDSGTNTPPCSTPNARPESHGADSNLSSLTEESSQGDVSSSMMGEQKEPEVPAITEQSNLPPNSKQEMPITTTATTNNVDGNIVTQSITSPLPCATESSNSNDAHPEHIPQENCLPVQYMPPVEEQIPDKKKKEGAMSHPPTPASSVAPSPGGASVSSYHEEFENIASPAGPNWLMQTKTGGDISKLYEMGNEPDRRFFIDRLLSFLDERNAPLNNMPSISKQPLDLYKLYFCVRERGGMLEVTKAKKWKEICGLINIGSSASAAFTLKKNYIKYLFHYECRFDRNGMDPSPILAQMEAQLQQKRESKNRRAPSPAGSQGSQDAFRPPSTPNSNSQGLDGFPPSMVGPGYMQNSDPNMGPMGGMMPQNSMMNNMMPPNSMGGMPHNQMMGGNMGNMHHPGMMGGNSYNMMPGHRPGMMMPSNNMMANNMNMPGNNMGMSGNNMGMPPGNNMGMPGNNMGMPPGNNMPSSGMASAPANSDCVSCQDPFSDEPNSFGYRQRVPPNSQMPNYSGMTPQNNMANFNNNSNFNRPNMPPSSISQSSIPPNSMGQNMPPNSMGQNMPPSSMGQNVPPNSMGQNVPPNSMGQNVPPNSMGQNMPPNSMGQSLSQSSMTPSVTMSSMGQSLPPTSITQSMPSSPMSQNLASNSMTSNSMPPNSMAQSGSSAGMGEGQALPPSNMPPNSMTQSIPPSSLGQSAPQNSMAQNMPPSSAPNFQSNSDIPRGQSGPQVPSQDQLNPFSNYQKSDISTTNTQANEKMSSSGQFTSNTNTTMSTGGRNFPFGDQFSKPERFDSPTSTPVQSTTPTPTPPPQRQPTPQSSQSMPPHPTQQQPSESGFPGRYGNQQPPPVNPQQGLHAGGPTDQYGHMQSFPPQQGFTTPNKGMMGHDQYSGYPPGQQSSYPGHRPPMRNDMSGPPGVYGTPSKRYADPFGNQAGYNAQSSGYNSQSSGYNTQSTSYSSSGMSGYNPQSSGYGDRPSPGPMQYPYQQRDSMSSSYDPQIMDGRGNAQWSSMPQRYPHGGVSGYNASGGMGPAPNMPSHMGPVPGSYRGHMGQRMSPTRDHKSGYMSPPKVKMPSQFPTKKEIPFPPDSVEAITPNYSKRRRLTKADVGQIEAWRVMMALKSGLLAESTWALDTLNILLYDDSAISFFNLAHLPGLLEVLLEHFRKCLISMFGDTFEEIEKMSDVSDDKYNRDLLVTNLLEEDGTKHGAKAKEGLPDYTYVTRQGKEVKVEEDTEEASPLDAKKWDLYCGYSYKYGHWQLGGGDMSSHVVPCFGSKEENDVFKKLFIRPLMELKDEFKEESSETNLNLDDSKNDSTEDVTKELQKEAIEETEQESMDTSVEEIPKDKDDSDEKVATNTKNNCKKEPVKEMGHTKNNILRKTQIKEEPVDLSEESGSLKTEIEMKKEPVENEDSKLGCELKSQTSEKCDVKSEVEDGDDACNEENIKAEEETVAPVEGSKIKEEEKEETLNNTGVKLQSSPSKRKADRDLEDESYQRDEPPLCTTNVANEELGRRCVCISNIFRSLSSIPSNHAELSKHPGFMYTLGKMLMLNHQHLPRNTTRKKFDRDDSELEDLLDSQMQQNDEEWWWEHFALLHENTFVILANICGHLELKHYPEEVCLPILDGLLHWAVCPSSCASDPLPSSATSVLSPQRLVLEALCKLCIHETNVDLLLATPPFDRIVQLFTMLTKCLANRSEPVTLEFAIVLLSELVQGDCSAARAIAMQHPSISLLLDFLETAEQKAMQVANHHGINALRDNPEAMGTSLDMLRRAANILLHLASVPENRSLFNHHQQRLLSLVMSQILDQFVAQILSDVLFQCFQSEDS